MASHKGTIQKVQRDRITIAQIEPRLPDYRRQVTTQAPGPDISKGQRVQFDYNRRGEVVNLILLDADGKPLPATPQPVSREKTRDVERERPPQSRQPIRSQRTQERPIEYYAYVVENDFPRPAGADWLHTRTASALEYATTSSHSQQQVKDQWQRWTLERATSEIKKGKRETLTNSGLYDLIACPDFHLNLLPKSSFAIAFRFTLAKPYLSGGEPEILPIDNPMVRDATFGLPTIRESAWKGHLRQVMRETLERFEDGKWIKDDDPDGAINRLFGHLDPEAAGSHQGYLHFYPTFFDAISLEIINPHDRSSRAGKNPISFEAVPRGTSANFILLYTPLVGIEIETAQSDLKHLVKGIHAMMRMYGFSAKATDGYGRAANQISPIADDFPMLRANTSAIAPHLDWQTVDDGQTFYVSSFPTLTDFKKIGE